METRRRTVTLQTETKTLVEVKSYLDELLQVAGLDESANGLVVGGRPMVAKVGLAINCSFQAIEAAAQRGCDLLATHHPARPSTDAHLAEEKHRRIRQSGINLYVARDCLDIARDFGTADALARAVGVTIQGLLAFKDGPPLGVHGLTVGDFAAFAGHVGRKLGTEPRAWKNSERFGHVGVIAGWGGEPEWMAQAQELGCDTVLTGEAAMFGMLFAREAGLNLVLAGHYATKTPGMMALGARIARDLQLDVTFIPEEIVESTS
jgi:putative NIF3 family GTP cyclohydrolase 1 type 2